MDGTVTFAGASIIADATQTILAVDRVGTWGAAFEFAAGIDGEYSATAIWAHRLHGGWEDMGSGGSHGGDWSTPWRPPADGWDGSHLLVLGRSGREVELDGRDLTFEAVVGFASDRVGAVHVEVDGEVRRVTPSPCGAFCALAVGSGALTLTPFDQSGGALAGGKHIPLTWGT